jgi:NitT/TauT family transport system substrate-binding protein
MTKFTRRDALMLGGAAALGTTLGSTLAAPRLNAQTLERVRFGTNWLAQAEHGGYYQAVADGTYRRAGLDVTIVPGGPQAPNRQLLLSGGLDFYMGSNLIQALSAVENNIPVTVIGAMFQKDPQVLIAHPGQGMDTFADLKKLPTIFVSREGVASYYRWLIADHGFTEAQVKPYTFNAQPFLADKRSAMQGYLSSEPFAIEKAAGFKPVVFLLADQGFDTYSTTIDARVDTITTKREMTQRFVDATITGWYNYLYGDNAAANALIKKDNPDMTDDKIAYGIAKMKEYGIADSGDTLRTGIGTMTEARVKSFFDKMVRAGVIKGTTDWTKAINLSFVNKGVGMNLRKS